MAEHELYCMTCGRCGPDCYMVTATTCIRCAHISLEEAHVPAERRAAALPRIALAALLNATAAGYAWLTGEAKPHHREAIFRDMSNAQDGYRALAEAENAPAVRELLGELKRIGAQDASGVNEDGSPRILRPGDDDFIPGVT